MRDEREKAEHIKSLKPTVVILFVGFVAMACIALYYKSNERYEAGYQAGQTNFTKPRQLLHFKPVCKGSDPNDVRIAQAELCRHEIDVKIDGDCGKRTALGICELLVKLQDGYEIKSIYEKR